MGLYQITVENLLVLIRYTYVNVDTWLQEHL